MVKRSLIATAAAATLAVVTLEGAEREVAMRIPAKEAMRELATKLQADLDAALLEAIEAHLGEPLTDPATLVGRFMVTREPGEDGVAGDVYSVDGVPILWAGPIGIERVVDDMKGTRTLRQIVGVRPTDNTAL